MFDAMKVQDASQNVVMWREQDFSHFQSAIV